MVKNINGFITDLDGSMLLSGSVIFTGLGYTTSEGDLTSAICYIIAGAFASVFVGLQYDRKKELERQKSVSELERIFD